jgi:hypothetical protein
VLRRAVACLPAGCDVVDMVCRQPRLLLLNVEGLPQQLQTTLDKLQHLHPSHLERVVAGVCMCAWVARVVVCAGVLGEVGEAGGGAAFKCSSCLFRQCTTGAQAVAVAPQPTLSLLPLYPPPPRNSPTIPPLPPARHCG